jgi:enoyl-CoA hydratase
MSQDMSELLSYEERDGVAVVTMDDGKANALSHDMLKALQGALDRAEQEAQALLLVGREGRFCAGFDLKTMMSGIEAATGLVSAGAEMYMRMYAYPLPVVAACTGHALAGGALLLLASDTRIAAEGAFKIGLNEVAISMPLPILAQELARDRLSKRHLTAATVQAKIYAPSEAVDAGYVDAVVAPESLIEQAHAEAKRLGALPRNAYGHTKAKLREATIAHIRNTLAGDMADLTPAS